MLYELHDLSSVYLPGVMYSGITIETVHWRDLYVCAYFIICAQVLLEGSMPHTISAAAFPSQAQLFTETFINMSR